MITLHSLEDLSQGQETILLLMSTGPFSATLDMCSVYEKGGPLTQYLTRNNFRVSQPSS